jgi:hypothetical protein
MQLFPLSSAGQSVKVCSRETFKLQGRTLPFPTKWKTLRDGDGHMLAHMQPYTIAGNAKKPKFYCYAAPKTNSSVRG